MKNKERVRRKSNEAEGTYREAAEEVDRDCKRNIEEENERELKVNCINIFQNQSGENSKSFSPLLFSRISVGLTFPCFGQPIMPSILEGLAILPLV